MILINFLVEDYFIKVNLVVLLSHKSSTSKLEYSFCIAMLLSRNLYGHMILNLIHIIFNKTFKRLYN